MSSDNCLRRSDCLAPGTCPRTGMCERQAAKSRDRIVQAIDQGMREMTGLIMLRLNESGQLQVIGSAQFYNDADSDGGECD